MHLVLGLLCSGESSGLAFRLPGQLLGEAFLHIWWQHALRWPCPETSVPTGEWCLVH